MLIGHLLKGNSVRKCKSSLIIITYIFVLNNSELLHFVNF